MYVRPQDYKYPSGMRLPENYSGNTFREPIAVKVTASPALSEQKKETLEEEQNSSAETGESVSTALAAPKSSGFGLRLGSLFGKTNGIGTEELLIIALILLLSDSDGNDDLILFLVLLFFIK